MDKAAGMLRAIGRAIRDLRARQRMTLDDLQRRSGLSLSFLSRVERGQAQASIANLIRIADALGSSLQALIRAPGDPTEDPGYSVFRAEQAAAPAVAAPGYRWQAVSLGGPGRLMEATLLVLSGASPETTRFVHPGEELCFVLDGRVRFSVGPDSVVLSAGDAIHLRSDIPHTAAVEAGPAARVLMVTHHPHGEKGFADWWNHGIDETGLQPRDKEEERI